MRHKREEANDLLFSLHTQSALKTSGASNGQTIACAVSTGTHGSRHRTAVPIRSHPRSLGPGRPAEVCHADTRRKRNSDAQPSEAPFHFEVVVNPHDIAKGAYVTTMYEVPCTTDYVRLPLSPSGLGPGDDVLRIMGDVSNRFPWLVGNLVNRQGSDYERRCSCGSMDRQQERLNGRGCGRVLYFEGDGSANAT